MFGGICCSWLCRICRCCQRSPRPLPVAKPANAATRRCRRQSHRLQVRAPLYVEEASRQTMRPVLLEHLNCGRADRQQIPEVRQPAASPPGVRAAIKPQVSAGGQLAHGTRGYRKSKSARGMSAAEDPVGGIGLGVALNRMTLADYNGGWAFVARS
jgi:hypothetical protein